MGRERVGAVGPYAGGLRIGAVRVGPPSRVEDWAGWPAWLLSLAIRTLSGMKRRAAGAYSHAFWWLGERVWEATARGMERGEIWQYRDADVAVDAYELPGLSGPEAIEIVEWLDAATAAQVPYDYWQIVRIATHRLLGHAAAELVPDDGLEALICSEAIALGAGLVGRDLPRAAGVPLWEFSPGHLNVLRLRRCPLIRRLGRLRFGDALRDA